MSYEGENMSYEESAIFFANIIRKSCIFAFMGQVKIFKLSFGKVPTYHQDLQV